MPPVWTADDIETDKKHNEISGCIPSGGGSIPSLVTGIVKLNFKLLLQMITSSHTKWAEILTGGWGVGGGG